MTYSSICTCTIKHPRKEAVFELSFKKSLKNIVFLKYKYFLILVNGDNCLFAFRQTLLGCSSNYGVPDFPTALSK